MMRFLEENVLKPVDPTIGDSDDWPTFELVDVFVYQADDPQTPTSLLVADSDSPVVVEGRLESVDRGLARHLIQKRSLPKDIKIVNVKKFAYGQYENGQLALWAAGRTGWFEIRPSEDYAPVFDEMTEAVRVLYYLEDEYRHLTKKRARRKMKGALSIGLQKYAVAHDLEDASEDDVAEIFYKHHNFLFATMLKKSEKPPPWARSPIMKHLKKEFPEEYALAQEKVNRAVSDSDDESDEDEEEESSQSVEVPPEPTANDEEDEQVQVIIEAMRGVKAQKKLLYKQVTLDLLAKALCETEVESLAEANELIFAHRDSLIRALKTTPPGNWWTQSQVYKRLVTTPIQPLPLRRSASNKRSDRRTSTMSDSEHPIVIDSDSDELNLTPAAQTSRKGRKGRKGKSVLRPRSSKYANKAAGRRGRLPQPKEEEADEDDMEVEPFISPSTRMTQTEAQGRSGKQLLDQLFSESDEDEPADPDDESLPVQWKKPDGIIEQASLKLVEEPLPSTVAQGPGDTWTCTFDGCSHKVYGASTPGGKDRIKIHFRSHADGPEQLIDLVYQEQRPYLPVNNLINRLRAMAEEQAADGTQPSGEDAKAPRFPKPINRKY
ncbi:hypothetical protein L228DRAFT_257991 [Xylona heveae TC161]|uniref:DNA (cytosine-5)-methyltransferase 1 replication foci domain-containing protein n=1 Tax=Xylona heveae (strain CBS 132557 / TC161) TaxID=1328760 RepID=A0A165JSZ1_XYLHT|nr:hypothetical protein L228DRAFT_257991 [Xylona heveae TC161]KZF26582.1 hypothetical protein L228DRAFT_257991 [Xylona heveae TC161]